MEFKYEEVKKIIFNKKIIFLSIIVVTIIAITIIIKNAMQEKNLKIIKEVEGTYTGYQLELTTNYGGTGIDGKKLNSGTIIKKYNIDENDIFYEDVFDRVWKLNTKEEFHVTKILKVIKFEDDTVHIEIKGENYVVNYNEKINVSSDFSVVDGTNYHYVVKIIKCE